MLRVLLAMGIALLGGGVAAVVLRDHPGYVLVEVAGYQMETTLAALVMLLIVALVLLVLIGRALRGLFVAPKAIAGAMERRRQAKALAKFEQGMLALRAERWQVAEVALVQYVSNAPAPALSYLAAAEAAHRQGARERRDEYLALAELQDETARAAIEMSRARWASEQRDFAGALQALDAAEQLRGYGPQAVQSLRLQMLEQSGDWKALSEALPRSLGALPRTDLDAISRRADLARLREDAAGGTLDTLRMRWQGLSKALRNDAEFLHSYVAGLHRLGADAEAMRLTQAFLKTQWDAGLAAQFGELHSDDGIAKLAAVEDWINRFGEKPDLLLLAGRLCIDNRLWGRARSYLESAQRANPDARVALQLGRLRLQEQDEKGAMAAFRDGLERAVQQDSVSVSERRGVAGDTAALPAPSVEGSGADLLTGR